MSDSEIEKKNENSFCNCSYLVQLTSQTDLPCLDDCLLFLVGQLTPDSNVRLLKHRDKLYAVAIAANKTEFDLTIEKKPLGKLVIEQNVTGIIKQQIETLCAVYVNQYRLINRINHDQLTKLGNRQGLNTKFMELLGQGGKNRRRKNELGFCLAIIDIDHFKRINDNFGHIYGDEVLLQLSQLMIKTFRSNDFLYRYGGEEFVVILSNVEVKQARKVLERFRQIVSGYQFPLVENITVSIGLTLLDRESDAVSTIERADDALYFAKSNGRNQLQVYESLVVSGKLVPKDKQDDITIFR